MQQKYFTSPGSVVRKIWGTPDIVLFIFAGASAEFALNKAVDWLYFTGKLPADPIGRLFSTVAYARHIVFAEEAKALATIGRIRDIHTKVEHARGEEIPAWAYRDVLFMLIHYSIAAFEVLERKLSMEEKEEVFQVFRAVGVGMAIEGLPGDYREWTTAYEEHLNRDLQRSTHTVDLFLQYKKHLGNTRFNIMLQAQYLTVPKQVRDLLQLQEQVLIGYLLDGYTLVRKSRLQRFIKYLLPEKYRDQMRELERNHD